MTPIERIDTGDPAIELWVKRDDLVALPYGGNKARKLGPILAEAHAAGARRLVTMGPAGSHHVLATTVHARAEGLPVAAALVPQPRTDHAVANLRAALAQGLEARPARWAFLLPFVLAAMLREGDKLVPAGGSSVTGCAGYVDAARELAAQTRDAGVAPFDDVVVALGSGGTAAGLLAGLVAHAPASRLVAVRVVPWPLASGFATKVLAWRTARRVGVPAGWRALARSLEVDGRWIGPGYGRRSGREGDAIAIGRAHGLTLDDAYTAKTLAAALDRARRAPGRRVLYWHTLSGAPMEPLLAGAPSEAELPPALRALFRG